ncbi:MAG: hypothetical protein H0T75_16775 [Rhizobiales bacterium]|nr:hypothetical protein [Hyphomicrobiales bacterium]MDQ3560357.1 hypothetical protein [Pseudomonadota bacterium]
MADPLPYPGAPRWVKISGMIGGALALFVVILILAGGGPGRHGPGRHASPSSVTEPGGQQP